MNNDFHQLTVWQKAMDLCEAVYLLVRKLPAEEKYALGDQLRRAVVGIPSNIAEGNGRGTKADYAHFLHQARGSLNEVRTQLELCARLKYFPLPSDVISLMDSVGRLLNALIRSLLS